jgi:hypothetical protein
MLPSSPPFRRALPDPTLPLGVVRIEGDTLFVGVPSRLAERLVAMSDFLDKYYVVLRTEPPALLNRMTGQLDDMGAVAGRFATEVGESCPPPRNS